MLANPSFALGFGIFLALAEGDWATGRPYQVAGWGFTSGMMYMSFFGHLEHWSQPPEGGWVPHGALVGIIGVLFALALAGLGSTLLTVRTE